MKFLLVQPPHQFLSQAYGLRRGVRCGHAPPLGLAAIGAALEADGQQVRILDAVAEELSIPLTVERIRAWSPDVVGMTVLTNVAESAGRLAEALRAALPEALILIGGAHATYFHRDILADMPHVDHVLYGEADDSIREYARLVKTDRERFYQMKGLVFRTESGSVQVNPPPALIADLDRLPLPAWHLLDMSLYRPLPFQFQQLPFFTLISSRGCPWGRCSFCFQAGKSRPPHRRHSPQRMLQEVHILVERFGIREIAFWDDVFVHDLAWMKTFCQGLKAGNMPLSWVASARVDSISREMVELIKSAGCWSVFLGVESGSQELLNRMNKGITLAGIRRAFSLIRPSGLETRAAFMLGVPGETPESGRATIALARELDPTYAIFYAAHPRRGTALYDQALSEGQFVSRSFRGMSRVTYVPQGYGNPAQLARMVRRAYREFYLRPAVIRRFLGKMLRDFRLDEIMQAGHLFLGLSRSS